MHTDGTTEPAPPREALAAGRSEPRAEPPEGTDQPLRLAGLLAHEARSPAAALVSLLDVLECELPSPPVVVAEVLEQMRIAATRVLRGLSQVQQVAGQPDHYRFVRLAALIEAFDRCRPHRSVREGRALEVEVVAEPAPLLDALAVAGAAMDPAPARVRVSSKGVHFAAGPAAAAPPLPAFLAARGATATLEGGQAILFIPFRLLDP